MSHRHPCPQWRPLCAVVLTGAGGLVWAHRLGLPGDAERALQTLQRAVVFGLIGAWRSAKAPAFVLADVDEAARPVPQAEPEFLAPVRQPEPATQRAAPPARLAPAARGLD